MTDEEERAYELGRKAAFQTLLSECIRELGAEGRDEHGWRTERAAAIAALRDICEDFGDNEWPDDLHLADVLEKHLAPYLDSFFETKTDAPT